MIKFQIGDRVLVKRLKRTGIVARVNEKDYEVQLGNLKIRAKESELEPGPAKSSKKSKQSQHPTAQLNLTTDKRNRPPREIDLHGYSSQEARDAVNSFINEASIYGYEDLSIVTGKGRGAVIKAVHEALRAISVVKRFELDPVNPGVTRVYIA